MGGGEFPLHHWIHHWKYERFMDTYLSNLNPPIQLLNSNPLFTPLFGIWIRIQNLAWFVIVCVSAAAFRYFQKAAYYMNKNPINLVEWYKWNNKIKQTKRSSVTKTARLEFLIRTLHEISKLFSWVMRSIPRRFSTESNKSFGSRH